MDKTYYCIGVMSGTSLDGIDVVYVKFTSREKYGYEILHSKTYSYSKKWISLLNDAFNKEAKYLKELDQSYAEFTGKIINEFIKEYSISSIDFIASHGHTIFHKPNEGYTLQIGCGEKIAAVTQQKVVYDFRTGDVALGGQGAPLVPIGDELLFSEYDYCLNLGGFANVSYNSKGNRVAFDICPVNIVMNYFTRQIGKEYDNKGELASIGYVNSKLLKVLNEDPFFKLKFPKSLGFEFVQTKVLPIIETYNLELEDILRTYVEHVAIQISVILGIKQKSKTLVTGGGVYNEFLLERIRFHSKSELIVPKNNLTEFKEALIFAFLGLRKIENRINCLRSVTGAVKNHSSGKIAVFRV